MTRTCGNLGSRHLSEVDEVRTRLESQASLHERLKGVPLARQRVDRCESGLHERCLQHERQQGENRVEALKLLRLVVAVGDTSHELGEKDQIDDEGGGKEGILALYTSRAVSLTSRAFAMLMHSPR